MAEVNTAEVEATVDAAFVGATLNGTPPAPAVKVVEAPIVDPAKPEPVVVPPVVVPEKPQYVRLTKQDWDNTKAAAGKVAVLESRLAKFEGSLPRTEQIVQQVIESVRAQTPAGTQIDPQVLVDAFADQEKDFPELAAQNRKAIEHVLKNLRGTGTAQSPAPPVDMDAVVEKVLLTREGKALEKAYPDWSDIVGRPKDDGTPAPNTEFRQWLAKQPADYQEEIGNTHSPAEMRSAIDRFKATKTATPPPPDKKAARRAVLEDAIQPRAEGTPPPLNPPQSAEDAFLAAGKAYQSKRQ